TLAPLRKIGVIGLGYVGLPLAVAFAREGCEGIGVDVDARKIEAIERAESYIEDVSGEELAEVAARLQVGTRYAPLADADAVLICVPTPLSRNREPDLGPLVEAGRALAGGVRGGHLVGAARTPPPPRGPPGPNCCRCWRSPGCPRAATSTWRSRRSAWTPAAPTSRCATR